MYKPKNGRKLAKTAYEAVEDVEETVGHSQNSFPMTQGHAGISRRRDVVDSPCWSVVLEKADDVLKNLAKW